MQVFAVWRQTKCPLKCVGFEKPLSKITDWNIPLRDRCPQMRALLTPGWEAREVSIENIPLLRYTKLPFKLLCCFQFVLDEKLSHFCMVWRKDGAWMLLTRPPLTTVHPELPPFCFISVSHLNLSFVTRLSQNFQLILFASQWTQGKNCECCACPSDKWRTFEAECTCLLVLGLSTLWVSGKCPNICFSCSVQSFKWSFVPNIFELGPQGGHF